MCGDSKWSSIQHIAWMFQKRGVIHVDKTGADEGDPAELEKLSAA